MGALVNPYPASAQIWDPRVIPTTSFTTLRISDPHKMAPSVPSSSLSISFVYTHYIRRSQPGQRFSGQWSRLGVERREKGIRCSSAGLATPGRR